MKDTLFLQMNIRYPNPGTRGSRKHPLKLFQGHQFWARWESTMQAEPI